jgi:hypothetical protein
MSGGPAVLAGQRATALTYNENVAGVWQALTLLNSWANYDAGYVTAQYRLLNTVTCEIIGAVTAGTVTTATEIFQLPAGYYNPTNIQGFPMIEISTESTNFTWAAVRTSGYITLEGPASEGDDFVFHAYLSLDA